MGADLSIDIWWIPSNKEPDWQAGKDALKELIHDPEIARLPTEEDIDILKQGYDNDLRDTAMIDYTDFLKHKMLVSGGMSWGDPPTETSELMYILDGYGIKTKLGFI